MSVFGKLKMAAACAIGAKLNAAEVEQLLELITENEDLDQPTLDDVMDWYSLDREKGEFQEEWQKKYPQHAKDLAFFEAFLQRIAGTYGDKD